MCWLALLAAQVQKALIDMENMFELLGTNSRVADAPGAKDLVVSQAEVAFERVVFGYTPTNPVLKGVSFAVPGACVSFACLQLQADGWMGAEHKASKLWPTVDDGWLGLIHERRKEE